MNPTLAALTLVLFGTLPACSSETVDPDLQGVASVIDGDTIEIHGARIRLNGIDAPESGQLCQAASRKTWRCGQQAALTLSDRIGRQVVSCQQTDTDRYGRVVADCYAGRENLNRWMVREGWAVAYRQYSTAYLAAEDDARTDQRGIWQGLFDMPWDWRAERRSGQDTAPPMSRLYEVAGQNWSCSPLRTCSQIGSCDEARWYLQNCPGAASLTATMTASPARASAERLRRAGRPGIVSGAMDT